MGKALEIFKHHPCLYLLDEKIYLLENDEKIQVENIGISKRIGVESAGADALLPYRFNVKGNKYVAVENS